MENHHYGRWSANRENALTKIRHKKYGGRLPLDSLQESERTFVDRGKSGQVQRAGNRTRPLHKEKHSSWRVGKPLGISTSHQGIDCHGFFAA